MAERPDYEQCIKAAFDVSKNALRCVGAGGSYDAQITWDSSLGAITHVLGPSDQPLKIASDAARDLSLVAGAAGNLNLTVSGGGNMVLLTLPSSDPSVAGALYTATVDEAGSTSHALVVKVSAG